MDDIEIKMKSDLVNLTSSIVAAHVSNNAVAISELQVLISSVFEALAGLGKPVEPVLLRPDPAVPIRSSIKPDYIVCLEDGKKVKMLKRYLRTSYGMTPEEYRLRWGLPADYPMVAPNYANRRRDLAKQNGLGRKRDLTAPSEPVEKGGD